MIIIENTEVTPWVTELKLSAVIRGQEQIETLGGTIYSYGTGTGEEIILGLNMVPSMVLGYIKDAMVGAGKTFQMLYPSDSTQKRRLCTLSGSPQYSLITPMDGGYWTMTVTIVTVD